MQHYLLTEDRAKGFTSVQKKTEYFDKSSKTIDISPDFFEPKWSPIMAQYITLLLSLDTCSYIKIIISLYDTLIDTVSSTKSEIIHISIGLPCDPKKDWISINPR